MSETGGKSVFHRPPPQRSPAPARPAIRQTQSSVRPVATVTEPIRWWIILLPFAGILGVVTLIASPLVFMAAVLIGLVPAAIARGKGRHFVIWWIYGAALFIAALPHALLIKTDVRAVETRLAGEGMKKCSACAEMIKADAAVCRYCGREVAVEEIKR